jgi:hypothetical protein
MGFLDQIVRRLFITTPETVNANWTSDIVSLDSIEAELSMSLAYENGSSVDMSVYMTFSNDGVNFARDTNTLTTITDSTGTILLDYSGVGTQFARWEIVVTDGSIDITESILVGKRNH